MDFSSPTLFLTSLLIPALLVYWCLKRSHKAATEIDSLETFLIYGKGLTRRQLTWTLFATNISLGSVFVALALQAADIPIVAMTLGLSWVFGIWVFWFIYTSPSFPIRPLCRG
jgi:hypothetical protein